MNPKLKAFLIVSAKQAINAVVGNSTLWALFPKTFNFHDWTGMMAFGKATLAFVLAKEAAVWGPKLLAWANSPTPDADPPAPNSK